MGCRFGSGRFSDGHIYLLPACCHGGMEITKKKKKKKLVPKEHRGKETKSKELEKKAWQESGR